MALASGLRRYLESTIKEKDPKIIIRNSVIIPFLEKGGKDEKYSLTKIIENTKNKKVGDWFNVTEICSTLTKMHNKNPMKTTQNLSIITFEGGILYI
jgi:hypothetical protein